MEHKAYVRIVPGADTAVLLIHGIVGTPNHFRDLLPMVALIPEEWSVYNVLLDGHGKNVEDFSRTSMKKWKSQVRTIFESLAKTHDRILIVGHSMGTLFAMELALEYPDKIPLLFLLAVPMRPGLRFSGIVRVLRMVFGYTREDSPLECATRDVCGVKTTRMLWKYIPWLPRFLELFLQIYQTERKMGKLSVPCVAYQSDKDELVMNCSGKLLERSGVVEVRNLPDSTHFYYAPEDTKTVLTDFANRMEALKKHD